MSASAKEKKSSQKDIEPQAPGGKSKANTLGVHCHPKAGEPSSSTAPEDLSSPEYTDTSVVYRLTNIFKVVLSPWFKHPIPGGVRVGERYDA